MNSTDHRHLLARLRNAVLALIAASLGCRDEKLPARAPVATSIATVAAAPAKPEPIIRPECIGYDTVVTLTGRLQRETHPGRPNYESIADGDEPETGFYLHLDAPICANASPGWEDRYPVDSTSRVQLLLGADGYAELRPKLGKRLEIAGEVFPRLNGHHHAPLLMWRLEKD